MDVYAAGSTFAADAVRSRRNSHVGHFGQANGFARGRVDQHVLKRVKAMAGFAGRPYMHIVGAATIEDIADLVAGHDGC